MSHTMKRMRPLLAVGALLAPLAWFHAPLRASDHADTAENYNRIGADMTDVFIFPSPNSADHVVLVADVHGLIPAGQGPNVSFDPGVLYQYKIDNTGDFVEDLVIQVKFQGIGQGQQVLVAGPMKPSMTGTMTTFGRRYPTTGVINESFMPVQGMMVFAGVREEPFFLDLERLFQIFPDRETPLTRVQVDLPDPNAPKAPGFRPPGEAMDFFAEMNVLSIIIELPRASLADPKTGLGKIGVWETTSLPTGSAGGFKYKQQDRLARPVVNEVLATVTNRRHEANNKDNPTDDPDQLKKDIESFLTFPAGRSPAIKSVIESVLVPDVMVADLSSKDNASYLGVETNGATGGKFGGRKLTDDVVDISLMIIFGDTIPKLGLAPDDGQEKPAFTTDNVGPGAKQFLGTFPYLGEPE